MIHMTATRVDDKGVDMRSIFQPWLVSGQYLATDVPSGTMTRSGRRGFAGKALQTAPSPRRGLFAIGPCGLTQPWAACKAASPDPHMALHSTLA